MYLYHYIFSKLIKKSMLSIAFLLAIAGYSSQSWAKEAKATHLDTSGIFKSCAHSDAGNTYCWENPLSSVVNSTTEQFTAENRPNHQTLFTQRLAAVALSIIVEFTTSQSFNDIQIN